MPTDSRITAAADLPALLTALREIKAECRAAGEDPEALRLYDMTDLPTYGGDEPSNTTGIWSWDAESLLVGTCIDDMQIVPRDA